MSPSTKLHLGSAGYCALLISLNWSRSIHYSRQTGLTGESFAPVALALLLSLAVAVYLAYHCVRAALARLEVGRKVRAGKWIMSWSTVLYTLPLLWHQTGTSSWLESDGTLATKTGGYGHELSFQVFLLAIAGLLLFQILSRLSADEEEVESKDFNEAHFARG